MSMNAAGLVPVTAESLNLRCACRTLNQESLQHQLEAEPSLAGLYEEISQSRPNLFSATTVFISPEHYRDMSAIVTAIESVVSLSEYQRIAVDRAPAIAMLNPGTKGVFMGFDFHLGEQGPQLIEINTNAGGALLNTLLARAQQVCCRDMEWAFQPPTELAQLEQTFFDMFIEEWRLQHGDTPIGRVAIVDDDPTAQYLYPEFQLFERLFARFGVEAVIADAKTLIWRDGKLWHAEQSIDMAYNRITDFYFQDPAHSAICQAYEVGAVVLTPHPRAHALYADKRNLAILSDAKALTRLGVPESLQETLLGGIPHTVQVAPEQADQLWVERRKLFFKPTIGYGSKATYRGDKLTRRVWEEILTGNYVAQIIAPPSERLTQVDGALADLKLDVRAYVYGGVIQLLAARLYTGQTTNFRTPGGGFAPVYVVPK